MKSLLLLITLLLSFSGICQNKINLNIPESENYDSWFVKYYNDTAMYLIAYDYSDSYESVPLTNSGIHYDGTSIFVYKLISVITDSYTPYAHNACYGDDYFYITENNKILVYELIGSFYGTLVKEGCFEDVPKEQVKTAYKSGKLLNF